MRLILATSALEYKADIAKVQKWMGHAGISTTRVYHRRGSKPENSPTADRSSLLQDIVASASNSSPPRVLPESLEASIFRQFRRSLHNLI